MDFINEKLISIEDVLKDNKKLIIKKEEKDKFLNGVKLETDLEDGIYRIYLESEDFIGTGEIKNKTLKRDVII